MTKETKISIKKGAVFGRLTVLEKADRLNGRVAWRCVCSCGTEKVILAQSLKGGWTQSCGCLHRQMTVGRFAQKAGLLVGTTKGEWTVLDVSPNRTSSGGIYFVCRCACGTEKEVPADTLVNGRSKSCGKCSPGKPVCLRGHVMVDWGGRTSSGACRACVKDKSLRREYGITLDDYLALWEYQAGKCAICGIALDKGIDVPGWFKDGVRPEVDHQHGGKKADKQTVRGILCGGRWAGCNRRLGKIDDLSWLTAVVSYLASPPAQRFFEAVVEPTAA